MAKVEPESWRTGVKVVSRRKDGRFAPGSQAYKPVEAWNTRNGVVFKFTDRDASGRFLPATNYPQSMRGRRK